MTHNIIINEHEIEMKQNNIINENEIEMKQYYIINENEIEMKQNNIINENENEIEMKQNDIINENINKKNKTIDDYLNKIKKIGSLQTIKQFKPNSKRYKKYHKIFQKGYECNKDQFEQELVSLIMVKVEYSVLIDSMVKFCFQLFEIYGVEHDFIEIEKQDTIVCKKILKHDIDVLMSMYKEEKYQIKKKK